jgi:hypothetical protein
MVGGRGRAGGVGKIELQEEKISVGNWLSGGGRRGRAGYKIKYQALAKEFKAAGVRLVHGCKEANKAGA